MSDLLVHPRAIAVIGMACRLPGARTVAEFQRNLEQGVESITHFTDQELAAAGVSAELLRHPHYVKAAPVLEDVDRFDADFFQTVRRDAELMDPQQRLFLECAWEALENAGYACDPAQVERRPIGVFGGSGSLMGTYLLSDSHVNTALIGPITSRGHIGNDKDHLCTRVAYKLNLGGPAITVQTACSTSLVAVHLACQSLLNGECEMALAGGVTVHVPHRTGYLYQEGEVFSPDGHCRAFDAQAAGTLFGSGAGIVVLKPLARALADGDAIAAVIRGSALGNDGSDKMSYWATNHQGQSAVMRRAIRLADVPAESIGYVEAHGTATHLGDMIELYALRKAFASPQRGHCAVGSVKSNIGHLDAAAGVAGLMKAVLSLQHKTLYPTLHFTQPNPRIDFANSPFYVNASTRAWETDGGERRAAVNSLGIGGTNAFVVLEEAPAAAETIAPVTAERPLQILTLATKSTEALEAMRTQMAAWLPAQASADWPAICHSAAVGRAHFSHRLAVVAASPAEAAEQLAADGRLIRQESVVSANARPKVAFLFTGQGSQYAGMGRELYATEPTFRAIIDRCDQAFQAHFGRSLVALLFPAAADGQGESADDVDSAVGDLITSHPCAQAANYALECALVELWRSWGVTPDFVLGHSLGDFAAAYTAGVIGLEDGLRLVTTRGRLMEQADGAMLAVMASEQTVAPFLAAYSDVAIGVINGPENIVVSGAHAAVAEIAAQLEAAGIKTRRLAIPVAAHSPLLDPVLDAFEAAVREVKLSAPTLPVVSSMTGQLVSNELTDPVYWRQHLRSTVRFADGIATLQTQGAAIFIEIGPKPTLLGLAGQALATLAPQVEADSPLAPRPSPLFLPSLRSGQSDWQQMLSSLGELYVHGIDIDWQGFDRDYQRRKVSLPTYPFQRQRYWVEAPKPRLAATAVRPLIDTMVTSAATQTALFETEFSIETLPFLAEHRVYGAVVSPGACQIALALSGAELTFGRQKTLVLEDVILPQALVIPEGQARTVQAVFSPTVDNDSQKRTFKIISFGAEATKNEEVEPEFATHAAGAVGAAAAQPSRHDLAALRQQCQQPVDLANIYAASVAAQIELGPSFRWVAEAWRSSNEDGPAVLVHLVRPENIQSLEGHTLHPGLLDACFQVAGMTLTGNEDTLLPFALEALELDAAAARETAEDGWWCHAVQTGAHKWDIELLNGEGQSLVRLQGFQLRAAPASAIRGGEVWEEWLYCVAWQPRPFFGLAPDFLPSPALAASKWREQAWRAVSEEALSQARRLRNGLEQVSIAYVLAALERAGFRLEAGAVWRSEQVARQIGVIPAYRRLLERLLGMLAEGGILEGGPDGWRVLQTPARIDPAVQAAELLDTDHASPEVRLLMRCGARLGEVLRGVQEPLDLLFPGGDATDAMRLYSETPGAQVVNSLVQQVVRSAVERLPVERGLRVVEIGAGTGGTTAGLLPLLPADRTDYLFTDIGAGFLHKAQVRFEEYRFLRCQTLDIEQGPAEQGFALQQADLVIAANVLHATRDLGETLTHVRQLLQPGGQLVLLETTARSRWIDLTFGLTEGWWRFADERQEHPLLTSDGWRSLLKVRGFAQVEVMEAEGQAVIVAQADSSPVAAEGRNWLILADAQGIGAALAAQLRQRGDQVVLAYADAAEAGLTELLAADAAGKDQRYALAPASQEAYQRLMGRLLKLDGVVHLWSLDAPVLPDEQRSGSGQPLWPELDLVDAAKGGGESALLLVQALLQTQREPAGLWLVTQDAQAVAAGDKVTGVTQSALWGMGKVIALEHPELNPVCVDLPAIGDPTTLAAQLCAEISAPAKPDEHERQVALRPAARYVARLQRFSEPDSAFSQDELALPAGPYRLEVAERGLLDNLQVASAARRAPGPGEVEIRVQASGLNFLDVLDVLGILPFERAALGGECAGEIVRVGQDVSSRSGLEAGARVTAFASGCFGQYVTIDAALAAPIPEALAFVEAASIPVNFGTAQFALHTLAHLRAGDKVLIHAAAGGTGMAAVQIAQAAGAEVYATASPSKWEALRALGVKHLYHSRTLDFGRQIREDTGGQGVDIVLNSLTGEGFVETSLALLAPGGRFLEIAKRNIWTEAEVKAFRGDIAYHVVDLASEIQQRPQAAGALLQELMAQFRVDRLRPAPLTVFALPQAVQAFRMMQQAQHVGKIVLTMPDLQRAAAEVRPDATYLITGGLGGLGLAVARWLVEQGARHLLLVGRSQPKADAQATLAELTELGAQVTVAQADVSDMAQLRNALGQVDARYPLAGVIHSVGVLDDGALLQQRWERFAPVLAPKMQGAWNLHLLTQGMTLDFFVLFSSAASLLGSGGQANHAAANAFLDAFVHYRRRCGLPALSINWSAWSEIGAAAELVRSSAQQLAGKGMGSIAPEQGVAAFAYLLRSRAVQAGVAPVRWPAFLESGAQTDAFYTEWSQSAPRPAVSVALPPVRLREQLTVATDTQRGQLLLAALRQAVAKVLGLRDPQDIDPTQGLLEMGLDSLMAVELRNRLAQTLELSLPSTLIFDYPTLDALCRYVESRLFAGPPATAAAAKPPMTSMDPLPAVDELIPDDDIAALLAQAVYSSEE